MLVKPAKIAVTGKLQDAVSESTYIYIFINQ